MKRSLLAACASVIVAVLVTACGGTGATSPTVTHTATPSEPALIQVDGFSYVDPSAQDVEGLPNGQALMAQANQSAGFQAITSVSVHKVTPAGGGEIVIFELKLGPKLANNPKATDAIVAGMAGGMASGGATVHQETIGGEKVYVATAPSQSGRQGTVMAWCHNGVVYMVLGVDADQQLRDFVTGWAVRAHAE
jgi:hypothetical protein